MAKAAVVSADENNLGTRIKAWPQRTKSFYNDVRTEMKKVTTPSLKEVRATTAVVIVAVAIFGVYFWIIDTLIGKGLDGTLRYFSHR
jgi:preprotein translocase subunit SecE